MKRQICYPTVHLRGAMGDLLCLFPILHSWLKKNTEDNKCDMIVSGPMNVDTLDNLLGLQEEIFVNKLQVFQCRDSHREAIFHENSMSYMTSTGRIIDLYLNHVEEGKILTADEVEPEQERDYTSVKYFSERVENFAPNDMKHFAVVSMIGNSNQLWKSKAVLDAFENVIQEILNKTNWYIFLIGQHPMEPDYIWAYPRHLKCSSGRIICYYNSTTLDDVVNLMEKAKAIVTYDNGVKNFAFLQNTPTLYIHEPKWPSANPVEAWFPKQLHHINNNFLTTPGSNIPSGFLRFLK